MVIVCQIPVLVLGYAGLVNCLSQAVPAKDALFQSPFKLYSYNNEPKFPVARKNSQIDFSTYVASREDDGSKVILILLYNYKVTNQYYKSTIINKLR